MITLLKQWTISDIVLSDSIIENDESLTTSFRATMMPKTMTFQRYSFLFRMRKTIVYTEHG